MEHLIIKTIMLKRKIYKSVRIVLLIAFSVLMSSCYFDTIIQIEEEVIDDVSFSDDVQPLLNTVCISCHNGTVTVPNLTEGQAYQSLVNGGYLNVDDPEESLLFQKINSDHPYSGALSASEINLIAQWMAEGGLDN